MVVAAVIGGVATAGSAVASSSAASKASNAAKDAATANNALQKQIYSQNKAALQPYEDRGNAAGTAINALLGLGGSASAAPDYASYVRNNPDLNAEWQKLQNDPYQDNRFNDSIDDYGKWHFDTYGAEGRSVTPTSGQGTSTGDPAAAANAAFDAYKGSTEYTSRLKQGQDSVTAALGGKGLLDSGAALKSLTNYGQTFASNEFGNYLGNLQTQQGAGLTATSAQAGVGQTYADAVSANNNNAANTSANASLAQGNAISSALGNLVTGYSLYRGLSSSYNRGAALGSNAYGIAGSDGIY